MLMGTTLAWFSDSVSSTGNIIKSGKLDVTMEYTSNPEGEWKDASDATIFSGNYWEPGYSDLKYIKVSNTGNLAFRYQMHILPAVQPTAGDVNLSDVIDVYVGVVGEGFTAPTAFSAQMDGMSRLGTLTEVMTGTPAEGVLLPTKGAAGVLPEGVSADVGEVTYCVVLHMQETAGNEYQDLNVGNNFTIQLVATQYGYEQDNFGGSYDNDSTYPGLKFPEMMDMDMGSADVTVDGENKLAEDVTLTGTAISATVKAGTLLKEGTTKLVLTVTEKDDTDANITLGEGEELRALDVHVSGIADGNTVPVIISLGKVAPEYLNQGNLTLAHVEDGQTVLMTRVMDLAELDAHNEYYYDVLEGELTVAMASFSDVAVVADTVNAWEGGFDYNWYDADATNLTIANADQLAAFGAIVGGMKKVTNRDENGVYSYEGYAFTGKYDDGTEYHHYSFAGKTIKLVADINLGDAEDDNQSFIFYPIGYYNSEGTYERTNTAITSGLRTFEGTFDGNGHTISNFYQNTWEMKGDHNWYSPEEQYYRDGMGLFGRVYGGTVKNLTVRNFKSDGEITTTGCIAAYADFGATFENIAIFECNPRVYNIGNGGIVGCVGWYTKGETEKPVTFKNITVDNSNKISALWGSYDVACGGLVGQYYPTSGQKAEDGSAIANAGIHMENCHVAAIMDVYNDVCANYQYYAYRYTGMLIGSVRENVTGDDGHVYPKMDGITASGCTVHFGTWNDYYYCEIIDNTTASYTHDYQMSRLTEIKAISGTTITYLDGTTGTVPASGRANYVIVDYTKGHGTENATCYHFKDGKVWNHTDAGTETVDGVEVLVEDKQHLYLEFNNLVTGYGWGVTSRGFNNLDGVVNLDVAHSDNENSLEKFVKATSAKEEYASGTTVTIGDLFASNGSALEIKGNQVQVFVSPALKENETEMSSTANGTYVAAKADADGTVDWTQGTLTFTGTGAATISITDYYYCKTTTINVEIIAAEKFVKKFDKDFLYRVGNGNAVQLGSLFSEKKTDVPLSSVDVQISNVEGNAAGTFTSNETWTNGTIQFTGTGVVQITISAPGADTVKQYLEVVDAKNVTTYGEMVRTSCVMLNNITMSDNGKYSLYDNQTLYGNGFTFNVAPGRDHDTDGGYIGGNGTVWVRNSTLDNVIIVGEVYTKYGGTVTSEYNFPTVLVLGNSTIANCYISNGSSPVRVGSGCNVEIINSTLEGGNFANLDIYGGTVKLKNVVTINQTDAAGNSISNNQKVVGLGIVTQNGSTITIEIDGLTQYNCISSNTSFTATQANQLKSVIFNNSGYSAYRFSYNNATWVNTGIVSMVPDVKTTNFSKIDGYIAKDDAEIAGKQGSVYAPNPGTVVNPGPYVTAGQYAIAPDYKFDYITKNNVPKQEDSDESCVYDEINGEYSISFGEGKSFTWDANILTVSKDGNALGYEVTVSGGASVNADKTITFDEAGVYTVTYRYADPYNFKLEGENIVQYEAVHEKVVKITVREIVQTTAKTEFAFGANGYTSKKVGTVTYVMPDVADNANAGAYGIVTGNKKAGIGRTVINGEVILYPLIEMHKSGSSSWYNYFSVFEAVTITDLNGAVYNTSSAALPVGETGELTVVGGFILNASRGISSAESNNGTGIFNYSTGKEIKCTTYSNYGLCYYPDSKFSSGTSDRAEQTIVVKYRYTDSNNNEYYYYIGYWCEAHKKQTCVTPDTLVTLADGTQKRIDAVSYNDQLLVWNFYTGEYDVAPASIIINHGAGTYTVATLQFSDGTSINTINGHGFYHEESDEFVILSEKNAADYVGHSFLKQTDDGFVSVVLTDYTVEEMETESWGILTAEHYNCMLNDMFTLTDAEVPGTPGYLMPFEVGEGMKYDEAKMQADIEKYGLYTYEDFADICTYEQFVGFGFEKFKVSVGKGYITWAEIVYLLDLHG